MSSRKGGRSDENSMRNCTFQFLCLSRFAESTMFFLQLDYLLDGVFDSQITNYLIIDCRFDYEYDGGHIPGAVNVKTPAALEELLLGVGTTKPPPCMSGDRSRKSVLVFH